MCKDCDCNSGQECGCGCECDAHAGRFERRYQTKTEQVAELESYLGELKKEVQAVEELLADLQK